MGWVHLKQLMYNGETMVTVSSSKLYLYTCYHWVPLPELISTLISNTHIHSLRVTLYIIKKKKKTTVFCIAASCLV